MTVKELLARADSQELSEWRAFYNLEPFGANAEFLGHAITASTFANIHRGKRKKPFTTEDFMPKFERKQQTNQTVEQQVEFAAMMTAALGGQDKRK